MLLDAVLGILAGAVGGILGAWISRKLGVMGVDALKPWRRERVPDAAGSGLALMLAIAMIVSWVVNGGDPSIYSAAVLVLLYNMLVGLADDVWRMDPVTKPILTMTSASLVMLVGGLNPQVYIPFFGWARLSIVYPAVLPLLIGVSANAFNMIDSVNGSMPTAGIVVGLVLIVSGNLMASMLGYQPPVEAMRLLVITVAGLLAYLLLYNRYPARVFNGDSGSLSIGALIGYLASASKQEAVYLVAITPLILNGFQIITTMRGFAERREIPRPTMIDDEGVVRATCDPRSPPTLIQLLTLREGLRELEIYVALVMLYLVAGLAAIAAAYLFYSLA
ncbi:Glycosyl transferase, family 4, conserved region [Pyrolobus fumarii 1A]|uniref:Glycosyl transferase, family 4, conserved region n=1 Tax=Pyrolobus fumarii (strain DSM 11204 / 1A) TaxID=694429 RepID=G0ECI7_PYRF1|nr:glycosyl transferase [Pyrolobus fumarii]AEM39557.1 Glycosyl transferase, family 4, conserved region [Pyrolobus fumarii 1A]